MKVIKVGNKKIEKIKIIEKIKMGNKNEDNKDNEDKDNEDKDNEDKDNEDNKDGE